MPDFPREVNPLSTTAEQPHLFIPKGMSGARKDGSSGWPWLPCWDHPDPPEPPVLPNRALVRNPAGPCPIAPHPRPRTLRGPAAGRVLTAPTPFQKELCFDDELVLQQLRYTGMLETVRIRRSGYSAKYTFQVSGPRVAVVTWQGAGHLPL